MGSQPLPQLHFVLIPLMGQGHLLPMADIAKLLAQRGVIVTVITTPLNALRIQPITDRAASSGLPIRLLQLPFPSLESGLPEGTETLDTVPSLHSFKNFFVAISMLRQPLVQLFEQFDPRPSCMISDKYLAFTADIARKFGIPRIVFDGTTCTFPGSLKASLSLILLSYRVCLIKSNSLGHCFLHHSIWALWSRAI